MNVSIFPESYDWLFAPRRPEQCCVWSFGRHQPPVEIGDDLVFRDRNRPHARAICGEIYKPGELNVPMHDGSRELKGWKVLWYQSDFEDLRPRKLWASFGSPPTKRMQTALEQHDAEGWLPDGLSNQITIGLQTRGLVELYEGPRARLTYEGLRHLRREVGEQRASDIEGGSMVCRLCGCTDQAGCYEGCTWAFFTNPGCLPTCSVCADVLEHMSILLPGEVA